MLWEPATSAGRAIAFIEDGCRKAWYVRNCSLFQRLDEATLRRLGDTR